MAATDLNVKYVAHLARLSLSAEEEQKFGAQLGNVLGYIEKLRQLDVSKVEPTAHATPLSNITAPGRDSSFAADRGGAPKCALESQRSLSCAEDR